MERYNVFHASMLIRHSYYLDVELMLKKNGLGTSDVAYSKISYR